MTYKCEDCNGGRNCDCPPMIAPTIWQHLWDYAVGFLAALGAMGLAACIGLYAGGYFEFLMKELAK